MENSNQPVNWFHKDIQKSNQHCLYCGRFVGLNSNLSSNKEHWIAREFVPKGSFGTGNSFNFIFRSCEECNRLKSEYERHISSISLNICPDRHSDERLNKIIENKVTRDYHPEVKGKTIKESIINKNIKFELNPNVTFNFNFVGAAQPKSEYIWGLANFHIKALYSLITSNRDFNCTDGYNILNDDNFNMLGYFLISDWGNVSLQSILRKVQTWPYLAFLSTANSYFRVIVRIDKSQTPYRWFWAIEWNKSIRVIGIIGDEEYSKSFLKDITPTKKKMIKTADGELVTFYEEIKLDQINDTMFEGVFIDDM